MDIIEEFSAELLSDLGIGDSDGEQYKILLNTINDRVNARLFLEIISVLSPEQAMEVREDMEKAEPNPEKLLFDISQKIPNFQAMVVQLMAKIRVELLEDLKPLIVKK